MKYKRYVAPLMVLSAVLLLGVGPVSAHTATQQVGGGRIGGTVYGYNMWNELITLDWVDIVASNDEYSFKTQSYSGGGYEMFVPTGTFNVTAAEPGFISYSISVSVSNGANLGGINFYLERSNVPVPEFPPAGLVFIMVLALAGALVAKRSIRPPKRIA